MGNTTNIDNRTDRESFFFKFYIFKEKTLKKQNLRKLLFL